MTDREVLGWCLYCKSEIYVGNKYVVNENGDYLHLECFRLIEDNADYFAR